ncbi:hypothetical protein V1L54_16465 [Streptomyces sp. TRM 70361]|uniref:hypothetical protein n=1 Tax=Streptomyces sp. TRM 70361 TaxID=3116553 RepID=UPI002E7B17F6|nr:hypothetical protein [Streptomyces sp. TRM 70361]MEE1940978.1 hypothetical protein [Streptomyces sp. TRM 70361]
MNSTATPDGCAARREALELSGECPDGWVTLGAASPASIRPEDFGPNGPFNPSPQAEQLLGYLAWCVSAAAVAGLIIVGLQMAMQLRRGEMGEGATYFRGAFFVLGACVLGVTAGPIVQFVVSPYLLR